jgi:alpha-L-arabinofuranosidase
MMTIALLLAAFGIAGASAAERTSLSPPVCLPNGEEFKTWETPLRFSRTYHVAQNHPKASDDNPGTADLPLKTIDRAAQLLQPGERVVVGPGVYRERVRPARGGTEPGRMISYEAAPGAAVTIRGSELLKTTWTPSHENGQPAAFGVWIAKLPKDLFPRENPFAQLNLTDQRIDECMDWAIGTKGKPPNTLRRGLVFQNGDRLTQVARYGELAAAPGTYWVEPDGLALHVHPLANADPNTLRIEITTRSTIFAPQDFGLGYIRVKGFTIEHAGNCFPRPQQGALSAMRGHHWIIENNTVRQCNAIGIDIGNQFDTAGPPLAAGGQHIVRRNTVSDCGIGGIEGTAIQRTLIEENHIFRCGWQRAELIWETGGIKVHGALGALIRHNVIHDTIDAPGIWMDYQNRNSRCTQNVIFRTKTSKGGIFMEASQAPNLVDRNIVWAAEGSGIYQHDCDELLVIHNLVGRCTDAGIRMQICQGREVGGRLSTAKRNKILGNILLDNGGPLAISDPENSSDWNVFGRGRKPFDLAGWQKAHGWDTHSTMAEISAAFNANTVELSWSVSGGTPKCPRQPVLTTDFTGRPYVAAAIPPGPFSVVPSVAERIFLGVGRGVIKANCKMQSDKCKVKSVE